MSVELVEMGVSDVGVTSRRSVSGSTRTLVFMGNVLLFEVRKRLCRRSLLGQMV